MKPATSPRNLRSLRILVVDAAAGGAGGTGTRATYPARALPELLRAGDLVVVNDAATLPASLQARTESGAAVELRIVGATPHFTAALLGSGDWRTPTERRPAPPPVSPGDELAIGDELVAYVVAHSVLSDRLVHIELRLREPSADPAAIWGALYRAGRPVQYAHVPAPLALWDVQNAWGARPWAVEMPSAGRSLDIATLLALRARGIEVTAVTHAAGVSATGHAEIDACLPLPERFEVSEATARAVNRTKARGGRVVAIGTSVVRALESAARRSGAGTGGDGTLRGAAGVTDLLLGPDTRRAVVDAVLTGVHESDTTHFTLLKAFADRATLDGALSTAVDEDLLGHEFGDAWLVWGEPATARVAQRSDPPARSAPAPCGCGATVAA